MAAVVGALRAELSASIAKFQSDMDKASQAVKRLGEQAEAQSRRISKSNAAWVGLTSTIRRFVTVAAFVAVTRSLSRMGDELQDAADQLHVTTRDLQGLRGIALDTGASTETISRALGILTDNLGDAEKGIGPLAKLMRDLEIPLGTNMQVFLDLADAVKNASSWNEKMRITTTALGAKQRGLVPLLNEGSDAIKRRIEEMEKLGRIASAETIAKLDRASDSWERLITVLKVQLANPFAEVADGLNRLVQSQSWREFWFRLAAGAGGIVAPFPATGPLIGGYHPTDRREGLGATAHGLREHMAAAGVQSALAGAQAGAAGADASRPTVPQAQGDIDKARRSFEQLQKASRDFRQSVEDSGLAVTKFARGDLPPLEEKLADIRDEYDALRQRIQKQIEDNAALAQKTPEARAAMERLQAMLLQLADAHTKAADAARAQYAAENALANVTADAANLRTAQEIGDLQRRLGHGSPISSEMERFQAIQRELDTARAQTDVDVSQTERDLVAARLKGDQDEIQRLNVRLDLQKQLHNLVGATSAEQIQAAERINGAFQSLTDNLSSSLSTMLVEWKGDIESLKGVFRQFINELLIKPAMSEAVGGVTGLLKGLFTSSSSSGQGGAFSALAALTASFAGGRALGGIVEPGRWAIAGERGPEPVFGGRSGATVFPNQAVATPRGERSSGGVTYIVDAKGADSSRIGRIEQTLRDLHRGERGRFKVMYADLAGGLPRGA